MFGSKRPISRFSENLEFFFYEMEGRLEQDHLRELGEAHHQEGRFVREQGDKLIVHGESRCYFRGGDASLLNGERG